VVTCAPSRLPPLERRERNHTVTQRKTEISHRGTFGGSRYNQWLRRNVRKSQAQITTITTITSG
jgi:hypothetical protein